MNKGKEEIRIFIHKSCYKKENHLEKSLKRQMKKKVLCRTLELTHIHPQNTRTHPHSTRQENFIKIIYI